MLGVAQKMNVGLGARLQVLSAAVGKALEGARRALLAEIACHGGAQLADGDAGAEQAEARRHGGDGLAHEEIGLDLLHRRHRAPEGEGDVAQDVERQAPDDAMRELRQVDAE